jgi:plasmid maintenance system killer protein
MEGKEKQQLLKRLHIQRQATKEPNMHALPFISFEDNKRERKNKKMIIIK